MKHVGKYAWTMQLLASLKKTTKIPQKPLFSYTKYLQKAHIFAKESSPTAKQTKETIKVCKSVRLQVRQLQNVTGSKVTSIGQTVCPSTTLAEQGRLSRQRLMVWSICLPPPKNPARLSDGGCCRWSLVAACHPSQAICFTSPPVAAFTAQLS